MNSNRFKLIDNYYKDISHSEDRIKELRLNTQKIVKISELTSKLKYNFIIKTEVLSENLIEEIWRDFISKKFDIDNNKNLDIINFAGLENNNCLLLEKLFISHLDSPNEDLIMIYSKNSSEIIYYLKSYQIINDCKISLPFHTIRIPVSDIYDKFNKNLQEGEIMIACL